MASKVLAVVMEPVSGAALKEAMSSDSEDVEVMVVAPALNSRFRFWMSDDDQAIARAEQVQEETVERLDEDGIDAAGDTGEADPLLAINDVLATFEADEIVLFTHEGGKRNWLEEGIVEAAKERFDAPVRHMIVG